MDCHREYRLQRVQPDHLLLDLQLRCRLLERLENLLYRLRERGRPRLLHQMLRRVVGQVDVLRLYTLLLLLDLLGDPLLRLHLPLPRQFRSRMMRLDLRHHHHLRLRPRLRLQLSRPRPIWHLQPLSRHRNRVDLRRKSSLLPLVHPHQHQVYRGQAQVRVRPIPLNHLLSVARRCLRVDREHRQLNQA